MRQVCAWCSDEIRDLPGTPGEVSHGACPPCRARIESCMGEYLLRNCGKLPYPLVVVDWRSRVRAANDPAGHLLGLVPEEAVGRPLDRILGHGVPRSVGAPPCHPPCPACVVRNAVASTFRTGRNTLVRLRLGAAGSGEAAGADFHLRTLKVGAMVALRFEDGPAV